MIPLETLAKIIYQIIFARSSIVVQFCVIISKGKCINQTLVSNGI